LGIPIAATSAARQAGRRCVANRFGGLSQFVGIINNKRRETLAHKLTSLPLKVATVCIILAGATCTSASPVPTASELLAKVNAKGCIQVSTGLFATDAGDPDTIPICQTDGAFWFKADMDIDCDGIPNPTVCGNDPTNQTQTSFTTSTLQSFDAVTTPYYVLPNATDSDNGGAQTRFNYIANNIMPGAVAAIIYNNQLTYAVFADEGPANIIGEASVATANALGIPSDPAMGGSDGPVYYIVFTGAGAVPSPVEDHNAATVLGQQLARQLLQVPNPPTGLLFLIGFGAMICARSLDKRLCASRAQRV
jgi:Fungal chitosanase of glycosyl hydrolase group 75